MKKSKILNVFFAALLVIGLASVAWATSQSIVQPPSSMRNDGIIKVVQMYNGLTNKDASTSWAQESTHYLTHNYNSAMFQVHSHALTYGLCYLRVDGSSNETDWSTISAFSWGSSATTQVSSLVTALPKYIAVSVFTENATQPCAFEVYGTFRK